MTESEQPLQVDPTPKLLRLGTMVRETLAEARRAPVDEDGRRLLRGIHERVLHDLSEVLPDELSKELTGVTIPFGDEVPTEAELRLSQAQLVGWLEGLFHGLQAAAMGRQMSAGAQPQLLPPGDEPEQGEQPNPDSPHGQYL